MVKNKPEHGAHLIQDAQEWPGYLHLEKYLWESELLPEPVGQVGQPWSILPGETRWHKRFLLYLTLGKTRTLSNAYQLYRQAQGKTGPPLQPVPLSWQRAFERFEWVERAAAWDEHLDAFIRERFRLTQDILRLAAPEAALTLLKVMREGSPPQQRQAADSILDRVGLSSSSRPDDDELKQIHIFEVVV